jgi:hypothetical protein
MTLLSTRRMARGKASMTSPDEELSFAGTAEPGSEHDPEAAEVYAESVGVDPSPEEIDAALADNLIRAGLGQCAETSTHVARAAVSYGWRSARQDGQPCCCDWPT